MKAKAQLRVNDLARVIQADGEIGPTLWLVDWIGDCKRGHCTIREAGNPLAGSKEFDLSLLQRAPMTIQVGDIVTWRHGKSKSKSKSKTTLPIGIVGCEVLELGTSEDGIPVARLKLPPFFGGLPDDACNGYVADLEK